jgi:TetR/AcrR family transcriptional repressor of nem operon
MEARPAGRRGPKPKPGIRDSILQAGLRRIHAEGYAATGIQSIVEGADVPKGTFYNHFPSKEAFGAEVIGTYSARAQDVLREALSDPSLTPRARLVNYFDGRIAVFRARDFSGGCLLGNFSAEAADHSTVIRDQLATHYRIWSGFLAACIAEAQALGEIDTQFPPALLANVVFDSWEGALLRMRAEKTDAPLLDFMTIIFDKLLAVQRNDATASR